MDDSLYLLYAVYTYMCIVIWYMMWSCIHFLWPPQTPKISKICVALSTTARLRWLAFLSLKILMILLLVKFHKLQKNGQCTVIKNGNNSSINHKFYLWMLRCKLCFTNANGIILQWSISNACVASLLKILDSSLLYISIYDCTPEAGVFLSLYHV